MATIAIEIGVALLFALRAKQMLVILLTNIATQIILNVILNIEITLVKGWPCLDVYFA